MEELPVELRPHPNLLIYYALSSLLLGPLFLALLVPRFIRYRTLRYRIDSEGVGVSWGVLFRREISLNYARIRDLHVSSNVLERWLGLAKIRVQTASGGAAAEMTVEGLLDVDALRDFLYSRMRGAKGLRTAPLSRGAPDPIDPAEAADALAPLLQAVADEIRALRHELGRDRGLGGWPGA